MKRSASDAGRTPTRRAQRLDLLRHDISSLPATPAAPAGAPTTEAAGLSGGPSLAQIEALVDARVEALVPAMVEARLAALRAELATRPTATLEDAPSEALAADAPAATPDASSSDAAPAVPAAQAPATAATPAPQAPAAQAPTAQPSTPAASAAPKAEAAQKPSAAAKTPAVRVVQRNEISGEAALRDASASLARRAPSQSAQPSMAPRCLAHASQHYLGATEDDLVAAWQAMRERFRLTPETKIQPRRALLEWLQRSRNVCTSNIHWYGDYFAVRACPVRLPEDHPGHGVDGWLIGFDPNGETFLRAPLFAEAFESPSHVQSGVVPKLVRPAWVSEARRAEAAARRGGEASRPFSPETADDLSADDFFRGLAD